MRDVRARVFDFDDTLAHSEGIIRVKHYEDRHSDGTGAWMKKLGIDFSRGLAGSAELTTSQYAKYVDAVSEMIQDGDLRVIGTGKDVPLGIIDVVDYTGVSRIINPIPISKIIKIAKSAFSRGEIVGIITARTGDGHAIDIAGNSVEINNRSGISEFMMSHGIPIQQEDIHCVGGRPGDSASNKAETMRTGFIEKYNPDMIIFYDDDSRNLKAVAAVDERIHCIDSTSSNGEWGETNEIIEAGRRARRRVSEWSRHISYAGIEK